MSKYNLKIDPDEVEYQLVNFIFALVCVNIFVGGMWLFGVGS